MINWLKLLALALELVGEFRRWVEREHVRTEAERKLVAIATEMLDANADRARAARERVRADFIVRDGGVRADDPYLRPDDWTGDANGGR